MKWSLWPERWALVAYGAILILMLLGGLMARPAHSQASATLQSAATGNGPGTALRISGMASVGLVVNCSACSGGTQVNFQVSLDGKNYIPIAGAQVGAIGPTYATSTTTPGLTGWQFAVAGFQTLQATISNYSAGTVTVTATAINVRLRQVRPLTTFYVAAAGNDFNPGTLTSPFATLTRCQRAMQFGGKTCYVRAGSYSQTAPISLANFDAGETWSYYPLDDVGTPVLTQASAFPFFLLNDGANNVTITGFSAIGFQHTATTTCNSTSQAAFILGPITVSGATSNLTATYDILSNFDCDIFLSNATNPIVSYNTIDTVEYAALGCSGCTGAAGQTVWTGNIISNVNPDRAGANGYGITLTPNFTTNFYSRGFTLRQNAVYNSPNWECFDNRGGLNIWWIDNLCVGAGSNAAYSSVALSAALPTNNVLQLNDIYDVGALGPATNSFINCGYVSCSSNTGVTGGQIASNFVLRNASGCTVTSSPVVVVNNPTSPYCNSLPPQTISSVDFGGHITAGFAPAKATVGMISDGGCTILNTYEAWLGHSPGSTPRTIYGFGGATSVSGIETSIRGAQCSQPNRLLIISLGISDTVTSITGGAYDTFLANIGTAMQATCSSCVFRFDWEMNGGFMYWGIQGGAGGYSASDYAAVFDYVVRKIRTSANTAGVNGILFEWNADLCPGCTDVYTSGTGYPGDAFVDIIGLDGYEGHADGNLSGWNNFWLNCTNCLQAQANFAKAHGKKLALSEWGVGYVSGALDDADPPFIIGKMSAWLNNAGNANGYQPYAYADYWNTSEAYCGSIDGEPALGSGSCPPPGSTNFGPSVAGPPYALPNSAAAFLTAFSGPIGTVVATLVPDMSADFWDFPQPSATFSIGGTNSGGFAICNDNQICQAPGGTPAGTYADFSVIASLPGMSGSPVTIAPGALTLTSNAFFVATNGSDGNPGTLTSPFATFDKCQTAMEGSSTKTCYIRAGTYSTPSGSQVGCNSNAPPAVFVQLTHAKGDDGETWSYYPPDGLGNVIVEGLTTTPTAFCLYHVKNVTVTGLTFQNFTRAPLYIANWDANDGDGTGNTFFYDTVRNSIPSGNNPGISIAGWSQNASILNNLIENVGGQGIAASTTQTGTQGGISGLTIAGNAVINSCSASGNTDCGAVYFQDYVALPVSTNITNRDNYFYQMNAAGAGANCIYHDDGASNVTSTGNVCIAGGGMSNCFLIHGGGNDVLYDNVCDMGAATGTNILFYQQTTHGNPPNTSFPMTGNAVRGNIIVCSKSTTCGGGYAGSLSPPAPQANNSNLYRNYGAVTMVTTTGANGAASDANPISIDAGLNCWNLGRNFGPPGFVVPTTGAAPSWPHALGNCAPAPRRHAPVIQSIQLSGSQ